MPYYIYKVKPFAQLEKLAETATYKSASAQCKDLRAAQTEGSPIVIRIIFAETELQAEDLLCQVRDPAPLGDD